MCLAIPGRVLNVAGDEPLWRSGRVDFGGVVKEVNLACLPEVVPGDFVLVHAGLAISRLDEAEALRVIEDLRRMRELGDMPEAGP